MSKRFYYFHRDGDERVPAGITVSKKDTLPDGDFRITEYEWTDNGFVVLWFIDKDKFTADERQRAWAEYVGI